MNPTELQPRLEAPFSAHMVRWAQVKEEGENILLRPVLPAVAVMTRLDAVLPNDWSFTVQPGPAEVGACIVIGSLKIGGTQRECMVAGQSYPSATEAALVRCASLYGIGRYLADVPPVWAEKGVQPELPEWAIPEHERSPGAAHIISALRELQYELPDDVDLQREAYRHLKAALNTIQQAREAGQ